MKLIPIIDKLEDNQEFIDNPLGQETLLMTIDFYKKVGFVEPWIGYFATKNGELVGSAGYKGKPIDGKVEIAYGTFEKFRCQGYATGMCKALVELALKTDPILKITARTLPEENFSTRVLVKNNFTRIGTVIDPEDGEVWEWLFQSKNKPEE